MNVTHAPQAAKPHFRKSLLALAASAALLPQAALALDLTQAPPATVQPYVAPNVILSLDDSNSMTGKDIPGSTLSRSDLLKQAVIEVFSDTTLLPDGKIRLAWQTINGNGPYAWNYTCTVPLDASDAAKQPNQKPNILRVLEGAPGTAGSRDTSTSRGRFLNCMDHWQAPGNTPTHKMPVGVYQYMTADLNPNGPWATYPGDSSKPVEYLACRRNYHIFMTDGGWNNAPINVPPDPGTPVLPPTTNPANYDGNPHNLPDGTLYSITDPDTQIYRDLEPSSTCATYNTMTPNLNGGNIAPGYGGVVTCMSTIADWSFFLWATQLQDPTYLDQVKQPGNIAVQPSSDYLAAPDSETFIDWKTTRQGTINNKYWNPRYDPATWPHVQTYTIGFSTEAVPPGNFQNNANHTYIGPVAAPTTGVVPYGYDGDFAEYVRGDYGWHVMGSDGVVGSSYYSYYGANLHILDQSQRGLDLWHAAINGRGKFYSVNKSDDMKKAFLDIIGNIITANEPSISTMAASGFSTSRVDVNTFIAGYEPTQSWAGYVKSTLIKNDGTTPDNPNWGGQTTAQKLTGVDPATRTVLSWSNTYTGGGGNHDGFTGGVNFTYANLSAAQKALFDAGDGNGAQRINYLRGDRANEAPAGLSFRARTSVQGDIVNSSVWYTGAPASAYAMPGYADFVRHHQRAPMIYVGGNDGMLHGFAAGDGTEKITYVPKGVMSTLNLLTDPAYGQAIGHRYFVDGSPMTGDANFDGGHADSYTAATSDWRTVLVGTLGAGGRGFFVLDVTDPSSFNAGNASTLVIADHTRGNDETQISTCGALSGSELTACNTAWTAEADLGNITAAPVLDDTDGLRATQIALMNNNHWAVVLGNGYNSINKRPVLVIQFLDGTAGSNGNLMMIPATDALPGVGNANDNGLGAPRLVDINGDGRVDVAYAGDNLGNLWKFDLTSSNPTEWGVAFGGRDNPLFTATGPASPAVGAPRDKPQPISAPPTTRPNDRKMVTTHPGIADTAVGGMMVVFGTGRNVATGDDINTNVQTLYSVLDNSRYMVNSPDSSLGQRLIVNPGTGGHLGDPGYVPAPAALGAGVLAANLAQQTVTAAGVLQATDDLSAATWMGRNGWYLDFPETGERLLQSIQFYDASNILSVYSQIPPKGSAEGIAAAAGTESCQSGTVDAGREFLTFINIMDGKAPSVQLIDVNGDGNYDSGDNGVSRVATTYGPHTQTIIGDRIYDYSPNGGGASSGNPPPPCPNPANCPPPPRCDNPATCDARMPQQTLLPSWRQWQ